MNLIGRYIFRELLASTAIVLAVLLLIFMSNQFAETLGEAATDALPREAVIRVIGLQFVQYVTLLAPIALLLGILLSMARMNRDSELTVLSACGIGPGQVLRPVVVLAVLLAIGVGWLSLIASPAASAEIERIRFRAQAEMELGALTAGQFTALEAGGTVFYAAGASGNRLEGVFIQRDAGDRVVVVVAEEGEALTNGTGGDSMLRLRNGTRYAGVPGEARFFVDEFTEHGIPIQLEPREFTEPIESRSTASLLTAPAPESRAELQWRLAMPLSILVMALLAVPLGRGSPRENRYARFGVGLLVYIIYANMLSIARVWVERELVPAWLGTWWVHLLVASLAVVMLWQQTGGFAGPRAARPS